MRGVSGADVITLRQLHALGHSLSGMCICTEKTLVDPACPVAGHSSGGNDERTVSFSPNGTRVVIGGQDTLFKIWNTEAGAEVRSFEGGSCGSGKLDAIRKETRLFWISYDPLDLQPFHTIMGLGPTCGPGVCVSANLPG